MVYCVWLFSCNATENALSRKKLTLSTEFRDSSVFGCHSDGAVMLSKQACVRREALSQTRLQELNVSSTEILYI